MQAMGIKEKINKGLSCIDSRASSNWLWQALALLPSLMSSALTKIGNFTFEEEKIFQWYPDWSEELNRAWNMHKNAQRLE